MHNSNRSVRSGWKFAPHAERGCTHTNSLPRGCRSCRSPLLKGLCVRALMVQSRSSHRQEWQTPAAFPPAQRGVPSACLTKSMGREMHPFLSPKKCNRTLVSKIHHDPELPATKPAAHQPFSPSKAAAGVRPEPRNQVSAASTWNF